MTLPSSGNIDFYNIASEVGIGIGSVSFGWIEGNTKDGASSLSSLYGRAWYQNNTAGNCNNGNCATNCPPSGGQLGQCQSNAYGTSSTAIQCCNCTLGGIQCANCDTRAWLQPNCNCACSYNCNQNTNVQYYCNCACACACASGSCFVAGSLVYMANGEFKRIEDIRIGDLVMGAYGEANTVLALDRPILGNRPMYLLNNEHLTSDDHPHVGIKGKFYSMDPDAIYAEWGTLVPIISKTGKKKLLNVGLGSERVKPLEIGHVLLTQKGFKTVDTIETVMLPPETQLYNLVLSGSHTYYVEGYAVTGWPREDDFDYDNWQPRQVTLHLSHYEDSQWNSPSLLKTSTENRQPSIMTT